MAEGVSASSILTEAVLSRSIRFGPVPPMRQKLSPERVSRLRDACGAVRASAVSAGC